MSSPISGYAPRASVEEGPRMCQGGGDFPERLEPHCAGGGGRRPGAEKPLAVRSRWASVGRGSPRPRGPCRWQTHESRAPLGPAPRASGAARRQTLKNSGKRPGFRAVADGAPVGMGRASGGPIPVCGWRRPRPAARGRSASTALRSARRAATAVAGRRARSRTSPRPG